jgi:hypothetical protein
MTIALGIRTPEGVVVATDSMRVSWRGQWPTVMLDDSKHVRLCDRLYYLVSGRFYYPRGGGPMFPLVDEGVPGATVDHLGPFMWNEVLARSIPAAENHDGLESPSALLVAGGPKGQPPGLMLYRSNRQPVVAPGPVMISGAITEWAEANGVPDMPAPAGIEAAIELAEDVCRGFLTDSYREWGIEHLLDPAAMRAQVNEPGGLIPPCSFPLHLVAITAERVTEWEVAS